MSLAWSALGRLMTRVRPDAPGKQAFLYHAARQFCAAYENEMAQPGW